jgi:hypothetical protein
MLAPRRPNEQFERTSVKDALEILATDVDVGEVLGVHEILEWLAIGLLRCLQ